MGRGDAVNKKGVFGTRSLVTYALCLSAALALSWFEGLLPPLIPVPGVRLGLNNIIVIYLLYMHGFLPAIIVSLLHALLGSLLGGGVMALPYSVCGSMLSLCCMYALKRWAGDKLSAMGVSVAGAFAHNMGQLLAASLILGGFAVFSYAPLMTLASAPTGLFVGLCFRGISRIRIIGGGKS